MTNQQHNWEPVKKWDSFECLPISENPITPGESIKNECRRIHNQAVDCLKQNPEDYISQGRKEAALDILAFVVEVGRRGHCKPIDRGFLYVKKNLEFKNNMIGD